MYGNKGGVTFAVIVIIIVSVAFTFVLSAPQQAGLKYPNLVNYTSKNTTDLWADANGWNFGHGQTNPTLNYTTGELITFVVTEADGLPHTLVIAPGPKETGSYWTVLTQSQITQTVGHVSQNQFLFTQPGTYTYWCTVHPATMVGTIVVTSGSSTSTSVNLPSISTHPSAVHISISSVNMNPGKINYTLDQTIIPNISLTNGETQ